MNRLIILDRDGVINHDSPHYIKSLAEWQPIDHSLEAIALLNQIGFRVVIATNQSGIGRGLFDIHTLNEIHTTLHKKVQQLGGRIEGIFFCPHTPEDQCGCRKPLPGMFRSIAHRFQCHLSAVYAVGDSLRDLQAAKAAKCQPILVQTGNGLKTQQDPDCDPSILVFENLFRFAQHLEYLHSAKAVL